MHKNSIKSLSLPHKSFYSLPFEGYIWKILINTENSIVLLELRNESTRQVSFAGIDLNLNKVLWHQTSLPEKWWVGMLKTYSKYVLLHGYRDFKTPAHQKVFLLDVKSGNLLWKNDKLNALEMDYSGLIVEEVGEESNYQLVDYSTGKEIKKLDLDGIQQLENKTVVENLSELQKPDHYSSDNKYFPKLAEFVKATTDLEVSRSLEYVEVKDKIVVSFYTEKEEKLVNYILVSDEEGNVLHLDKAGEELKSTAPETFFLYQHKLIYIKNRKELIIFELQ